MKRSDPNLRKLLKPAIISFSLVLIVLATDQEALGYQNESTQEEYLDFQSYTGNRFGFWPPLRSGVLGASSRAVWCLETTRRKNALPNGASPI